MTHYCSAQTYARTRETPAEYCENEVPDDGDLCPIHEDDEPDYDAIRKDRILDEREN